MNPITLLHNLLYHLRGKDRMPLRGEKICRLENGAYTVRPNTMDFCRTPREYERMGIYDPRD